MSRATTRRPAPRLDSLSGHDSSCVLLPRVPTEVRVDQIHFRCPNDHPLRVRAAAAGKRMRCPAPGCGAEVTVPPLPDLAPALTMPSAGADVARRGILRAQLTRGQNRLAWTLDLAREAVEAATV